MNAVMYFDSDIPVKIGDHVRIKSWSCFWRGWVAGRVVYVPGISDKNPNMEFNGLSWVCINSISGSKYGCIVHPDTFRLKKNVRYISRSDDDQTITPKDFDFND